MLLNQGVHSGVVTAPIGIKISRRKPTPEGPPYAFVDLGFGEDDPAPNQRCSGRPPAPQSQIIRPPRQFFSLR